MQVEILTGDEGFYEIRAEYELLYQRAEDPNVFLAPEWVYGALQHLNKDYTPVVILVRTDAGELCGLWPFFECPAFWGMGLWPIGGQFADFSHPLLLKSDGDCYAAIMRGVAFLLNEYQFIWFPLIPYEILDVYLKKSLKGLKMLHAQCKRAENLYIDLKSMDYQQFLETSMGTKTRKTWRYEEKQLKKLGKDISFVLHEGEGAILAFMPKLLKIERESWKVNDEEAPFARPEMRIFYRNALPELAKEGRVVISSLELDGQPIAYELGIVKEGYYGVHSTSYMQEYAKYSPGRQLMLWNIKRCFEAGLKRYDFMQGDYKYKLRYATHSESLNDVVVFKRSLGGWVVRILFALFRRKK